MKRISSQLIYALLAVCLSTAGAVPAFANPVEQTAAATDRGWPRTFAAGMASYAVYQPQIEYWKDNRFRARAAVAITTGQDRKPAYGVIWFTARTEVDKLNRLVTLTDFVVMRASFPASPQREAEYQSALQRQVPKSSEVIALDRLLAELAITETRTASSGFQLNNDPPRVIFSTRPAILILIDGEPVLRAASDTDFQRVVNTRALILRDKTSKKHYLHLMDGWMEADVITGPWKVASSVPQDLEKASQVAQLTKQVDLMEGASGKRASLSEASRKNELPTIYVTTEPAELLQAQGEPQFAALQGTQLIYVTNSENDIFVDTATQDHYVLISGRWFRSRSLQGRWEYVAGQRLPADFANIPPTHAKASVLASVPGTPQAREALIANEIPQTATIKRSAATLIVNYDGSPLFRRIEGTALQYAVNTSTPVIALGTNSYYAVVNGVWFVASAPTGPWKVATFVPSVIYTIPPNAPLHHVTYVKVYGSTAEVVYVGYTPGYYGTVVSSSGVVVYGSGWYYTPYIGTYWYGFSYTYGYGAGFTWSVYGGWGVAYGIGYGWSTYYYPVPVYAGYYPAYACCVYGGAATASVYGQWGNIAYSGTRAAWANPYTGNVGQGGVYSGVNAATGTQYNGRAFTNTNVYTGTSVSSAAGTAYNPNTGRSTAGQAGVASNAYTGDAAAGARGARYNPETGIVSGGAAGATYDAATGQTSAAKSSFAYNSKTDTGVAIGNNNVYAGKDGEVYRYNQSDGLQQHTDNGWQSANRPDELPTIQAQQGARATGQQRWDGFQASGARPASFNGGGQRSGAGSRGFRGGGGRVRR